jgi:tetratricopeptide (TPR) repeat protein
MTDKDKKALYAVAAMALASQRWREAERAFARLVEAEPQSAEALMGKGLALVELGQVLEARTCFEDAGRLGHPRAAAGLAECRKRLADAGSLDWVRKAEGLLAARRFPDALASAQAVLDADPDHETALFIKGNACYSLGQRAEALRCYTRVTELNPGFARAWNNKGWLLLEQGDFEGALADFTRATEIDGKYADGWMNKGAALMEMEELAQALSCFERAQALAHPNAGKSIQICRAMMRP